MTVMHNADFFTQQKTLSSSVSEKFKDDFKSFI